MMGSSRRLFKSFKMLLAAALIWPVADLAVAPAQAQGIEFWNKGCLKAYKKWKTLGNHKAFALSNSNAGGGVGQTCGYSWSAPTKAAAEKAAIRSCEGEKIYRSGKCRVTKSQ